jgi:hypothetical protein
VFQFVSVISFTKKDGESMILRERVWGEGRSLCRVEMERHELQTSILELLEKPAISRNECAIGIATLCLLLYGFVYVEDPVPSL